MDGQNCGMEQPVPPRPEPSRPRRTPAAPPLHVRVEWLNDREAETDSRMCKDSLFKNVPYLQKRQRYSVTL